MYSRLYENSNISLFINSLPGAFLVYKLNEDQTDEILFISDTSENLWGVKKEDALRDIRLLWRPILAEDLDDMALSIKRSAENLSFWDHTWRIKDADGNIKWLNGRAQPIKSEIDGSIIWQSIILDVSSLKIQEEKVFELSAKLNEYAQKHSHELRTPITQLMGLLSLVQDGQNFSNRQESDYLKKLIQVSNKLDQIMREMASDLELTIDSFPQS